MRRALILIGLVLLIGAPARAAHADTTTATITAEVGRTRQIERHVVSLWWLPLEYWVQAARELKKTPEQVDMVRRTFRNYVILAILDAESRTDGSFVFSSHSVLAPRLEVRRNGTGLELLHEIEPSVATLTSDLSYFLTASLGALSQGLKLFFLPNVDRQGRPILQGISSGRLDVLYRHGGENASPLRFHWHAPLTSVAGSRSCPEGKEPLEASWIYCPWHGVRVR